ncbi:hypothetical protein [Mesorhizobium sp. ORS 3428]|uniref:hypothetical protein n=1 Tax=Mesorhizobium sp. ORS 3428 TaxID=540997 RepID=UPI001FCD8C9D|nr:hypothetical protein [Mesorhizobium sp. ORS 3428]
MGALERGDSERALAIYTDSIQPSVTAGIPINVISDTASFLWRLQAYGHTTPAGLWEAVATYSEEYFQKPGFTFADVHMALIAAAVRDWAAVEQRVDVVDGLDQSRNPDGRASRASDLPGWLVFR